MRSVSTKFSVPTTARMISVGAQGQSNGCSQKEPRMDECSSMPISDVCTCRYIECITDQNNWSGLFSLVVVWSLYNPGVMRSIPGKGAQPDFLYRCFFLYYSYHISLGIRQRFSLPK